ncbi:MULTISPECIES: thiamine phosphate synthase [Sphingomonas]|uniref:thiamine phosphate synthase n=1 Tax=Sphingomonas TaxID=13687 RepID=UPI000DEFD91C|nr:MULTISPECIES: thiamine phosphate synthase [Sphingomonas]
MTTQRWPGAWLMTDERMGEKLWPAIECAGDASAGIILRHHATEPQRRRVIGSKIADLAHKRGLTLGVARDAALARELGARLVHNPDGPSLGLPFSRAVHDEAEALAAAAEGAALVFVSPVYATRSHSEAVPLGEKEAARLAGIAGAPAYALGGIDSRDWRRLRKLKALGFSGWAGIDAWIALAKGRFRL